MTIHYYRGIDTRKINAVLAKVFGMISDGKLELTLKNGEEVVIYGNSGDWLIVDSDDREYHVTDDYDLAVKLFNLSRIN